GHRPLLDFGKHEIQFGETSLGRVEFRILQPVRMADNLGECWKGLCLSNHVLIGVGISLPALASDDPARVASSRSITGAGHGGAEFAVGVLRIFFEWAMGEPLLVTQLYTAEIQYGILHR